MEEIKLTKIAVHNLKNVDLTLPANRFYVFTGVSGSGKSSIAHDTIFAEGQRRYLESLSTHARRALPSQAKPDVEKVTGLSPTIAIEQKTTHKSPRSTVGTMTGIYDFLRVVFAKISTPHCPVSGEKVQPQSETQILDEILQIKEGTRVAFLAPYARGKKSAFKEDFAELYKKGFMRVVLDGQMCDLSEPPNVDGSKSHNLDIVVDRIVISKENQGRIKEGMTHALEVGKGVMSVLPLDGGDELLFSTYAYSPKSNLSYPPLEPHDFSFNHPQGMCPDCEGLGTTLTFDLSKCLDPKKSIEEDCFAHAGSYNTVLWGNIYRNIAKHYKFSTSKPFETLSEKAQDIFLNGAGTKRMRMTFTHPTTKKRWIDYVAWAGVLAEAKKRYQEAKSDAYKKKMEKSMSVSTCPKCRGSRIAPYPSAARFKGQSIDAITAMTISDALEFFSGLKLTKIEKKIGGELIKEIKRRLEFLLGVGLHYLSLDRLSSTISGGEAQRVRLSAQIGSGLTGTTYVLDEPSIGLHPIDTHRLIGTLTALRDKGNTIIVVEHDKETMCAADAIVDVGPGAGIDGGEILCVGSLLEVMKTPRSVTGAYLRGDEEISVPKKRRPKSKRALLIEGAKEHNLKNLNLEIPLEQFVCVTGVSGSGKSTLILDTLAPYLQNHYHRAELTVGAVSAISGLEHLNKVIAIDQSPIGRTPRSNPATYIKLLDDIRELFASLPAAKAAGYHAGRFSFNVKEGSCPNCRGMGTIQIDMDFLEDAQETCAMCQGRRYDPKTLAIQFKGKSIDEVLNMTVREALSFFEAHPTIFRKLQMLEEVGLNYMRLGQSSKTLSGGEAQRIKLAKELVRPATGRTLYILDEPTTGLHFADEKKLIAILHRLVDAKNTVLVIEHNMDLVKTADTVIDLGPEGGQGGGQLMAIGTPEEIATLDTPTGLTLKEALHPKPIDKSSLKKTKAKTCQTIEIVDAEQNNLKKISLTIPRDKITVLTGPSGSGKSSLAFETVYAEGQRRYIQSLPAYAKQFVQEMPQPKVGMITGLSPAIAVEQKKHAGNPRSTVGTMTEIYDFLRILYTHLGTAYCPETGEEITAISESVVLEKLLELKEGTPLHILAPLTLKPPETLEDVIEKWKGEGFLRLRVNETIHHLDDPIAQPPGAKLDLALVVDRLTVKPSSERRLLEGIEVATKIGKGKMIALHKEGELFFNLDFAVPSTGRSYPRLTPHSFSFNSVDGMCQECQGIGIQYGFDLLSDEALSALSPSGLIRYFVKRTPKALLEILKEAGIDPKKPIAKQTKKAIDLFLHGAKKGLPFRWMGLYPFLAMAAKGGFPKLKEALLPHMKEGPCPACKGSRLNPLSSGVKVNGTTLPDLTAMPLVKALPFLSDLTVPKILDEVKEELSRRLTFLNDIGLNYLSLNRSAPTLSGGETQRIHLARQLGSALTGCLYVLDEPTIGLHPHNNIRLGHALTKLRDLGNTLLLVEHDPLTVEAADYLFDFGPKAGAEGGQIVAQGTIAEIKANPKSLTGAYLSGKKSIPIPTKRRSGKESISIKNANVHNLDNLSLTIPKGAFTCITGVSGSGKSTLVHHVLHPAITHSLKQRTPPKAIKWDGMEVSGLDTFAKCIALDQSPIGTTARADISTFTEVNTHLRRFFAELPEAQIRGLMPVNFSYNHLKGMCRKCWGLGYRSIRLQLMPPVRIKCASCQGNRLKPLSLEVTYKGKNFGQLLNISIDDALDFLPPVPRIQKILTILQEVGLGYLKLGQEIQSLSGGEGQRLRLTRELIKRSRGKTLYLFDEPTVGLHSEDILKLLPIFHRLVDKGHTLVMIEHNLDVIANSDYLIDIGPDAGINGGKIVATGTPEELAQHPSSHTALYLKEYF